MDMALAYWRGRIASFRSIYTMMEDAGRLIDEYYGDLAEEPQDYYVARSVLVADAVVDATNREAFREMLLTFNRNVSPSRVCHYEVFRRRAYDARRVAQRAFVTGRKGAISTKQSTGEHGIRIPGNRKLFSSAKRSGTLRRSRLSSRL